MLYEVITQIRQLIDLLPPEQREVLVMRHYGDMSFKEIAASTKVSINTALGRRITSYNVCYTKLLRRSAAIA